MIYNNWVVLFKKEHLKNVLNHKNVYALFKDKTTKILITIDQL